MDIQLLTIGKTTQSFIKEGIEEYSTRLRRYIPFSLESIQDIKTTKSLSPSVQKEREGELITSCLNNSDHVVILDERGKQFSSIEFASRIERIMSSGKKRCVFVVGGPYGFSEKVYNRADEKISLSRMTFTHEMVRLFFVEQIYRAMTILRGEPYHHE